MTNARLLVGDAYVKRCVALPGSLLALRIPAIDASIAMVPQDAVNWLDADRVSELRPLDQGRRLLITRRFDATPDDPLEGRRERLSLVAADGKRRVLLEHCLGPHRPMSRLGDLALQCAREQAGDAVLHSVHAFDAKGEQLGEFERCRNPRWAEAPASQRVLVCDAESVGPDGQLKLQRSQRSLRTR